MTTKLVPLCFGLTFTLCIPFSSPANPVGGSVAGGDANATISGQGTALTTINQTANRVIINWQDFSIGAGEVTRFLQPSARSAALNRIMSGNPSQIYGSLQANGRVFVINPSGILVGPSGRIDTGGFVASTLDVSDASFKAGGDLIFTGTSAAGIRNQGSIQALGGDVYLIAHNVENSGSISAPQGTVGLAAGNTVELVQSGNEHLSVLVGNSDAAAGGTGVNNLGSIEAASAELKAAGGNIYALAINNGGAVRATGIVRQNGHVYLRAIGGNIDNSGTISAANADGSGGAIVLDGGHNASTPSTVTSSGTLSAKGTSPGTDGGTVEMLGDHVGLFDDALVDASGDAGGGTVLIGGDYRGANPDVQNAQASFVGPDARIRADSLARGNGGKVVVWSDGTTRFYGTISAQGGELGGDGGAVETSGHYLDFQGIVSTLATSGNAGSLLLDPTDLTIDNTSDQNINAATPFVPSDTPSHLTWATIDTALGSGNVTVTTVGSPNSGAEPGNITVAAASPVLNRNNDLTLDAAGALNISSGSTIANSGTGNLNLTAADTATIDAAITLIGGLSVTAPNGIAVNAALQASSVTLNNAATLNAAGTTATPSIKTGGGGQTYGGAVTLGDATVLEDTANGAITFNSTINGAQTLELNTAGATTLGASVGGGTPLAGLETDNAAAAAGSKGGSTTINGTAVDAATISFGDAVTLGNDVNMTSSSGPVTLGSTVDGTTAGSQSLTINGDVSLGGAIGGSTRLGDFAINSPGAVLVGHNITANSVAVHSGSSGTGDATFGAGVTVDADTQTYQAGDGSGGAGTAAKVDLVANTPAFSDTAGAAAPGSFTYRQDAAISDTEIPSAAQFGGTMPAALILQSDDGGVTLPALTLPGTLQVTANGPITDSGAVTVAGSTTLAAGAANDITLDNADDFGGAVSTTSARDLTLNDANTLTLGASTVAGAVNVTAPGGITVDGAVSANSVALNNAATLNVAGTPADPSVRTSGGGQTYGGAVTLAQDAVLEDTGSGAVDFNSTVNADNAANNRTLSVNTGGSTVFGGSVGDSQPLAGLTTDAAGSTTINGVAVNATTADFKDDVTLGNNVDVTGTTVSFEKTVNADSAVNNRTLTVNASGDTTFGGTVGNSEALAALTTDTPGNTTLNGDVTTTGNQTYNDNLVTADGITLTAGTVGIGTRLSPGGDANAASLIVHADLSFGPGSIYYVTLNGKNNNQFDQITINSGSTLIVDSTADIAGQANFSFAVNNSVHIVNNNGNISGQFASTSLNIDGQQFAVTYGVGHDVILTRSQSAWVWDGGGGNDNWSTKHNWVGNSGVPGDGDTVTFAGTTRLTPNNDLTGLTLDQITFQAGSGSFTLGGNAVSLTAGIANNSANGQTINMPVTLAADQIFNAAAGALTFGGTIDGAFTLILNGASAVTLGAQVGGTTPLSGLAVNSTTPLTISGPGVITSGAQTYSSPVTLGNTAALTSSGGLIALGSTVDGTTAGSQGLTVNGAASLGGAIGGSTALANFDVNSPNAVAINQNITANSVAVHSGTSGTGDTTFGAGVIVKADTQSYQAGDGTGGAGTLARVDLTGSTPTFNNTGGLGAPSGFTYRQDAAIGSADVPGAAQFGGTMPANLALQSDDGGVTLPALALPGTLQVAANGPITDSGALTVAGTTTLAAGAANDITLDNADDFVGAVSISSGNNVTLNDVNALTLGASTVSGNLTLAANGLISDAAAVNVAGTTALAAGGNDITFDNDDDFGGAVNIISGNNVTLNDLNALTVGGAVGGTLATSAGGATTINSLTVGGDLVTLASGLISDSGPVIVAGTTLLGTIGNNDIILNHADDFGGAVSVNHVNNLTLNDVNALTFGGLMVSGNLNATADGPITDSGNLTIAGTTTLAAGAANNISLDNADDFGGAVDIVSGNNVALSDVNALTVGGTVSGTLATTAAGPTTFNALNVGGNLNVTANGLISDDGNVTVAGTSALAAGAGNNITLDNADDFNGAVSIVSGNNVTLNDANALTLGLSLVSGNLNLSANGPIADNGNVTVAGTTTLAAGAGNDVILDNADDFGGAVSVASGNNVTLNDVNALTLGASTIGGNLNATANGPITDNGNVTVAGTTTLAAGAANNITLDNADDFGGAVSIANGNNVTLNDVNALTLGASTVSGNLNAAANGPITDVGNVIVAGATTLAAGAGNDITLDNADDFGGAVSISSGNNVTLNDVNALTVGGTVNGTLTTTAGGATTFGALNVSDSLAATANGLISDNGNLTVLGATTLAAGAGNDITLDNADDFGGAVSISSANNVTLNDVNALDLGASAVSGNLAATANGPLTDSGNLIVAGVTTLAAGGGNDITLDNADNFGGAVSVSSGNNVTLNDVNALTLGASTVSGDLAVTAGGPISQNGAITAHGAGATATFAAGAGNNITLNNLANDFTTVAIGSGNNVLLADANAIDLGASTISGQLVVTAGGNITESGSVSVAGNSSFATAGGNSITLDQSGNNFNGAVAFSSTDANHLNNVAVANSSDFNIGGLILDGTLSVNSGGQVTQSGNITANALEVTAAGPVRLGPGVGDAVSWPWINQVNTIAAQVQGSGGALYYLGQSPLTVGTVDGVTGITTDNGNIVLSVDSLTILNQQPIMVDSGTATALVQPQTTPWSISFDVNNQNNALFLSQEEVNRFAAKILQIGNVTVLPIIGRNLVSRPSSVGQLLLVDNSQTTQVGSSQLAQLLAGAILPVPKLDLTSFSSASIDAEAAAKILPPGSIGTLFLQVPFIQPKHTVFKIEDVSKWTGGLLTIAGTTSGAQTPR